MSEYSAATSGVQRPATAVLDAASLGHALPADAAMVAILRRYYHGEQTPTDALTRRRVVNFCARLSDTLSAALTMTGVSVAVEDEAAHLDTKRQAEARLWELCEAAQLPIRQLMLYRAVAVDGEAYLVLGFDGQQRPTVALNRRLDTAGAGIEPIVIDADGEIREARKQWVETLTAERAQELGISFAEGAAPSVLTRAWNAVRGVTGKQNRKQVTWRVVYREHEILRFLDGEPYDAQPWPYPVFPVVRFTSPFGGELTQTIRDQQDAINSGYYDLVQCSRIDGLRILWGIDVAPVPLSTKTGADGLVDVDMEPGVWYALQSMQKGNAAVQGKFGAIDGSNLVGVMDALKLRLRLAGWSGRMPVDATSLDDAAAPESGRARMARNRDFDAKVAAYQASFDVGWSRVFEAWQRMDSTDSPLPATAVWRQPDYSDAQEDLYTVQALKTVPVDDETIYDALDLTPEQKQRSRDAAAERRAQFDQQAQLEAQASLALARQQGANGQQPPAKQPAKAQGAANATP